MDKWKNEAEAREEIKSLVGEFYKEFKEPVEYDRLTEIPLIGSVRGIFREVNERTRNQVTEKLGIVLDNSAENLIEQMSDVIKSDCLLEKLRKSNASYNYDNTLIKEQLRTILYN